MKKKVLSMTLVLVLVLSLASCSIGGTPAESSSATSDSTPANTASEAPTTNGSEATEPVPTDDPEDTVDELVETFDNSSWKIGIMTTTVTSSEECYRVASAIQEKYGKDRIIIQTYPDAIAEVETTINNAMMLAADPDCKAILFCQAMTGTIAAIEKIRAERPDILLIAAGPQEEVAAAGQAADVCYVKGGAQHGVQIAEEAHAMGAKYLLHYSFPRSMSIQVTIEKHDAMKARAEELGMTFIDVTTPDPKGDSGITGCQQFILEDVANKIQEYGVDCAFYGSTVQMQEPLVKAIAEYGAIYTMAADPSPFQGYIAALGLEIPEEHANDTEYAIQVIHEKLDEMGLSGRFGCWNFSIWECFMNAGVDYAIAYLNGETDGICDSAVLQEKLEIAAGSDVEMTPYTDANGLSLDNTFYFIGGLIIL